MKSSGLLPLTLLVLATLAPWAVEGAGEEAVKAGGCPRRPLAKCREFDQKICQNDWQCPRQQKCCQDMCSMKCFNPVKLTNPVKKTGQCPAVYAECMMLNPPNYCEMDSECQSNLKCCKGMCGKVCIAPVIEASSKGGAQP